MPGSGRMIRGTRKNGPRSPTGSPVTISCTIYLTDVRAIFQVSAGCVLARHLRPAGRMAEVGADCGDPFGRGRLRVAGAADDGGAGTRARRAVGRGMAAANRTRLHPAVDAVASGAERGHAAAAAEYHRRGVDDSASMAVRDAGGSSRCEAAV